MAYPGSKTHRSSRRRLGKGQHPQIPAAVLTPTFGTSTVTLTSSVPLVVSGTIPLTVTGTGAGTFISQSIVSPTVVTQTWSTAFTTAMTVAMAANPANVQTAQGGGVAAFSVTG